MIVLTPVGMTDHEKHFARFYSGGQVLTFSRDNAGLGIARDTEYRVVGTARDARGCKRVLLVDEHGRTIQWDPRVGRASQVNVFRSEQRDLAKGDRIQWRLVNHDLDLKNAERGTVEMLRGAVATIRWDRDGRVQDVDLGKHKNWDHGYAETVYSAQSKTYDRAYILAPVNSGLVTGQNYYTAITRARFGVKLWTEDQKRLVDKLTRRSGEKTSALQGLGRLGRDSHRARAERHGERWDRMRADQREAREERKLRMAERAQPLAKTPFERFTGHLADRAQRAVESMERYFDQVLARGQEAASEHGRPHGANNQPGNTGQGAGHEH